MTEISAVPAYMRRAGEFDPDPSLATLRERTGIARVPTPFGYDAWLVTRHADVRQTLSDAQRFSVAIAADRSDPSANDGMSDEDLARERAGNLMAHRPWSRSNQVSKCPSSTRRGGSLEACGPVTAWSGSAASTVSHIRNGIEPTRAAILNCRAPRPAMLICRG
jgi:hypothetical protein